MKPALVLAAVLLAACAGTPPSTDRVSAPPAAAPARASFCLNGEWDFRTVPSTGAAMPADGWRSFRVPGSWGSSGRECFALDPAELAAPAAWYRRTVEVPAAWQGAGRVFLRLDAVVDGHAVEVNGRRLLDSPLQGLCERIDITGALRFGEGNQLAVYSTAFQARGAAAGNHRVGVADRGLVRDVWLELLPELRVDWSHALPNVRDRRLAVRTRLVNEGAQERQASVRVQVLDRGRPVLALPVRTLAVPAGGSVEVETAAPWADPVLWGFGEYGTPHLYTLRTEIDGADRHDDRFGFREFRAEGERLLFNGKPFFIKGDLLSRRGIWPENAAYSAAYYQRLRDGGMNLQRMHSMLNTHFDDPAWYQVADEVGMLVEAQLDHYTSDGRRFDGDAPEVLAAWTAYVNRHFNHPSLVMWSVDNETFSVEAKDIPAIPLAKVRAYDALMSHVRALDPTRIAEIHHNWTLWHFVKSGDFKRENFTTFNIHPYGKLDAEVRKAYADVGFPGGVPTIIGEVYTFPKNLDPVNAPGVAYGEQYRKSRSYDAQLTDVARVPGVAGIVLCAMMADGWVGFTDPARWHLGPWSDLTVMRDGAGAPVGMRHGSIAVPWPSLSGAGVKVERIPAWHLYWATGFGLNLNWFDAQRPMWLPALVDRHVRTVFDRLGNGPEAPLAGERAAEVLVGVADQGAPVADAFVSLEPLDGQPALPGVVADRAGTAWLRAWEPGRYRLLARLGARSWQQEVTLARSALTPKAGYGHLQVAALGGDAAALAARLAQPAALVESWEQLRGDVVENGRFTVWTGAQPLKWNGTAERLAEGGARLRGPKGVMTTPLKMDKGRSYTLRGRVRAEAGQAQVTVKDASYAMLAQVKQAPAPGWQPVEAAFTAAGNGYLYVEALGPASAAACFADLAVLAGPPVEPPRVLDPGPWKVGGDGFIRQWLALGPVPNRLFADGTYEGFATDWLKDLGGEPAYTARFAATVAVTFPPDCYWKAGPATLRWRQLSASNDRVLLNGLGLTSQNISDQDPVNVAAYLACTVISPVAREAELALGSDDGYKAWLNGEQVAALSVCRGSKPDQERHPVKLRQGENRLLLKVFQDSGGFNCWVRFRAVGGAPLSDLKVRLEGEPAGVRTLTPEGGGRPLLLADGRTLVYEALDAQGGTGLRQRDLSSGDERELGAGANVLPTPDGRGILFLRGGALMRQRLDGAAEPLEVAGGAVQRLYGWVGSARVVAGTAAGLRLLENLDAAPRLAAWPAVAGAAEAAVSRDGRLVALVAPDANGNPALTVRELEGGKLVAGPFAVPSSATSQVGGCHSPVFSPDGRRLVFVRAGIQPDADLALVDLASGKERALTSDRARNRAPQFTPDGRGVLFSAAKEGEAERCYLLPLE